MHSVNRHLGGTAFKFEGLKDLADLAEKGDYAVSYDRATEYYLSPCPPPPPHTPISPIFPNFKP